jgi:hypothetical protein
MSDVALYYVVISDVDYDVRYVMAYGSWFMVHGRFKIHCVLQYGYGLLIHCRQYGYGQNLKTVDATANASSSQHHYNMVVLSAFFTIL